MQQPRRYFKTKVTSAFWNPSGKRNLNETDIHKPHLSTHNQEGRPHRPAPGRHEPHRRDACKTPAKRHATSSHIPKPWWNPDETLPAARKSQATNKKTCNNQRKAKPSTAKQSKAEDGPHLINTTCRRCCYSCCFATLLRTSRPLQETTHRSVNLRHNQDLNSDFQRVAERSLRKFPSIHANATIPCWIYIGRSRFQLHAVDRRSTPIVCSSVQTGISALQEFRRQTDMSLGRSIAPSTDPIRGMGPGFINGGFINVSQASRPWERPGFINGPQASRAAIWNAKRGGSILPLGA